MNYDKISFRTNQQEKELLTRLNQVFKCKTMTGLMHRMFNEAMKRGLLEPKTNDDSIFGEVDFRPANVRQTAPDNPQIKDDMITLRDTRQAMVQKPAPPDDAAPKTRPEPQYDPLTQLIHDIEEFEKLGRVVQRSRKLG